jgi:hypothetical protein
MKQDAFVNIDVINIYSKILTDVIERTHGVPKEKEKLLWDNCIKSESSDGLITLLAKAMADKADLYIVYEPAIELIRLANEQEKAQIKADYESNNESSVGVYISFKNYVRSDMVKLYSSLEYCTVGALSKAMNLAKALQIKINDLRASVSLTDSETAKAQGSSIGRSLANGKDIILDAKDMIETSKPDLTAVKESILFLNQKRAFYLGMPEAYINGIQTGGLGTTGENDTKAIERGLKIYFMTIIKPTLEVLLDIEPEYKSQDFRQITQALEAVKTFSLVDEEFISVENKTMIINKLLDLPEDAEGDGPEPAPKLVEGSGQNPFPKKDANA